LTTRLVIAALFGAWFALLGFAVAAEELSGPARVIDSNTLEIGGRRIRLIGVDAPELDQMCPTRKGEPYPCGRVAAQTLVRLVKDGPLDCRGERADSAGRLLTRCTIRGFDVGEQYILTGRAFADPETGGDYRRAEGTAAKLREGMWRGEFQKPWEWRATNPAAKAAK
jgi:endonuclease YncB( thermonuclease family)